DCQGGKSPCGVWGRVVVTILAGCEQCPRRGTGKREQWIKEIGPFNQNGILSGSGAVKIIPYVTSKGTSVKPGVLDVTEEESSKSKAESWGNDKDDGNNEQESSGEDSDQENDSDDDKTQSNNENKS
ncbi:hypothetical protein Tco_0114368, partial [Tanacetum coccineum]